MPVVVVNALAFEFKARSQENLRLHLRLRALTERACFQIVLVDAKRLPMGLREKIVRDRGRRFGACVDLLPRVAPRQSWPEDLKYVAEPSLARRRNARFG